MQEMQVNLQINRLVVVLAAVLGAVTLSASVGNYRFTHITSRDGLPHQQVQALANDGRGQLWIGTRNGLSVYDYMTDMKCSTITTKREISIP